MIQTIWNEAYYKPAPVSPIVKVRTKSAVETVILDQLSHGEQTISEMYRHMNCSPNTLRKNVSRMTIQGTILKRQAGIQDGRALYKWRLP